MNTIKKQNFESDVAKAAKDKAEMPNIVVLPGSGRHVRIQDDSGAPRRGLLSGAAVRSGYVPGNEFFDQLVNRGIAAFLLVLSSPIFLVLMALQKIYAPGDMFYRGPRLGKDKVPFKILKFRTLVPNANQMTRDKTLPRRNMLETRIGGYLRRSRLDELPQLINILRGEMVFFGPRPIRPEMETIYRVETPDYEQRFKVRPGLVGLAQAIMSHETPKSVRARLNRQACNAKIRYGALALFVGYVGFCVIVKSLKMVGRASIDWLLPLSEHGWLRSGFVRPRHSRVEFDFNGENHMGAIAGMSDEVIQIVSCLPLPKGQHEVTLIGRKSRGRELRLPVTIDIQEIAPVGCGQNGLLHYGTYTVKSEAAKYFVERYFLQAAVVPV